MPTVYRNSEDKEKARYRISCEGQEPDFTCTIPHHEIPDGTEQVEISLDFLNGDSGTDGYYVIPYAKACFLTRFRQREETEYICRENIMPILGAKMGERAFLLIMEGMMYDYQVKLKVRKGFYSLSIVYDLTEIDLYEDISFRVIALNGGEADYNGMAHSYRRYQQERKHLIPLRERMEKESVMNYGLKDMPIIRIRLGWKPVPSPVLEQTLATEPPMHVACTFAQVEALMEEMRRQGIPRAELCLVGWNSRGHDGRWPQMFPVEEQLGGEEGLRSLIAHAKNIGYRITCHTNSSDTYRIADCFEEADVIKKKDQSLSVNENTWSGGRMYNLCPKVASEKYLEQNLKKLNTFGFEGFHYIDVLTSVPPRTCYDPRHPLNASQSVGYLNHILKRTRQEMGGIASEGGFDFAAENLDFSLYIAFNLLEGYPLVADEIIPLWQLVYHGYILSNPSAETVNFPVKEPDVRLKFYEYGGIPVIYFYSRFVGGADRKNWMGDKDMTCATEEERVESVSRIKKMMEEYRPFAGRQLAFMERHDKLAEGVYQTTYSDGYRVIVNDTEQPFLLGEVCVPAKEVVQVRGGGSAQH